MANAAENLSDTPCGLPLGAHPNVPTSVYHGRRLGVVSKSALDMIRRSPAHYKAWVDGAIDEDSPALSFGRAFHCALLEPERFASSYVAEPDFGDCRFKAAREARDAWRQEHADAERLSAAALETIRNMVAAVRSHKLAGRMISDGKAELTLTWRDEETGLQCKCRSDYYVESRAMVADVKSTADASPDQFRKDVARYRYYVQDALYRAGFAAVGVPVQHFVFIAVEKTPPYAVGIYTLDADGVGRGYSAARYDMDVMAECLRKNEWPGYSASIQTIELPPWA